MSEKLQKVLARAGLGSRREMERWIEQGRVTVDGVRADIGDRVDPEQCIRVDGRQIAPAATIGARRRVILYHKPEGELCTRADPQGRPTVFEHLPRLSAGRWILVGRLDLNSAGLLLLTNDGELADGLMHPRSAVEREYAVRVLGAVSAEDRARLLSGVELDDGPARFESIREGGGGGANRWYHVVLVEGRKREVRRLWEAVGAKVSRLIRVRFGPILLPRSLRLGRWCELERAQRGELARLAGVAEEPEGKDAPARRAARPYRHRRGPAGKPRRRRT